MIKTKVAFLEGRLFFS